MGYDFDGVARAALAAAHLLLPRWMGGKRVGTEWAAGGTKNGGIGDSWSVNLETGRWRHFAGPESGSDLISLYSELFRVSQNAARLEVERQLGGNGEGVPVLPPRIAPAKPRESKADPISQDAADLQPHPNHGATTAEYRYGTSFRVTRYDTIDEDGKPAKVFAQWTWRNGGWAMRGYGPNRPPYQAHVLRENTGAQVLIVEGEKCVHAAQPVLDTLSVTTWSGGVAGIRQTDWSALKGRDVVIWPDADEPGRKAAAELAAMLARDAQRVRVVNPNGADPGWDIADAVADGWDATRLAEFMKEHMELPIAPVS